MNLSRRASLALGIGALASPLVVRDLKAQAQVTLRLHHFLPPASNGQQRFLAQRGFSPEAIGQLMRRLRRGDHEADRLN